MKPLFWIYTPYPYFHLRCFPSWAKFAKNGNVIKKLLISRKDEVTVI